MRGAGGLCWALSFFLLRRNKRIPMPISASAPTPPITPPTMAPTGVLLLLLLSLVGCDVLVLLVVVVLVWLEVGDGAPVADPDFDVPEADVPVTVYPV